METDFHIAAGKRNIMLPLQALLWHQVHYALRNHPKVLLTTLFYVLHIDCWKAWHTPDIARFHNVDNYILHSILHHAQYVICIMLTVAWLFSYCKNIVARKITPRYWMEEILIRLMLIWWLTTKSSGLPILMCNRIANMSSELPYNCGWHYLK